MTIGISVEEIKEIFEKHGVADEKIISAVVEVIRLNNRKIKGEVTNVVARDLKKEMRL
ncbi:hypothetical protein ABEX25_23255 [Paenibacillus thiaminolyticus]|uniref:hypothetical protein n=1 Tax=Paenibacillus thiaminolyticus TaxID=49283 RepID=UPI003D2A3353